MGARGKYRFSKRGCGNRGRQNRRIVAPAVPRFCSISQNRSTVPDQGATRVACTPGVTIGYRDTPRKTQPPAMLSRPPLFTLAPLRGTIDRSLLETCLPSTTMNIFDFWSRLQALWIFVSSVVAQYTFIFEEINNKLFLKWNTFAGDYYLKFAFIIQHI